MNPLTVTRRHAAAGPVLEIIGDLDHETVPELRTALDDLTLTPGQLLVLDLAGMEFCDSSGINVMLVARNLATEEGAGIALAEVPANTARILRLVGLDRAFALYPGASTASTAAAL